jgi:hypothetical protein
MECVSVMLNNRRSGLPLVSDHHEAKASAVDLMDGNHPKAGDAYDEDV